MNNEDIKQRWGSQKREQNKSRGQQAILEAAKLCFANKGLDGTTFEDIAQAANISRRTIYRYFDNKQAIIESLIDLQVENFFERLKTSITQDSDGFLQLLENLIVFFITQGPEESDHDIFLGKLNAEYSRVYYLNSETARALGSEIIEPAFQQAQAKGEIIDTIAYNDLMQWVGRVTYSFIEMPAEEAQIRNYLGSFFLNALKP